MSDVSHTEKSTHEIAAAGKMADGHRQWVVWPLARCCFHSCFIQSRWVTDQEGQHFIKYWKNISLQCYCILTLLVPIVWFSLSISIHVLSVMSDALMLPASLSLSPELCVLDVLSLPARSTNDNWLTQIWFLSCTDKIKYQVLYTSLKDLWHLITHLVAS